MQSLKLNSSESIDFEDGTRVMGKRAEKVRLS